MTRWSQSRSAPLRDWQKHHDDHQGSSEEYISTADSRSAVVSAGDKVSRRSRGRSDALGWRHHVADARGRNDGREVGGFVGAAGGAGPVHNGVATDGRHMADVFRQARDGVAGAAVLVVAVGDALVGVGGGGEGAVGAVGIAELQHTRRGLRAVFVAQAGKTVAGVTVWHALAHALLGNHDGAVRVGVAGREHALRLLEVADDGVRRRDSLRPGAPEDDAAGAECCRVGQALPVAEGRGRQLVRAGAGRRGDEDAARAVSEALDTVAGQVQVLDRDDGWLRRLVATALIATVVVATRAAETAGVAANNVVVNVVVQDTSSVGVSTLQGGNESRAWSKSVVSVVSQRRESAS